MDRLRNIGRRYLARRQNENVLRHNVRFSRNMWNRVRGSRIAGQAVRNAAVVGASLGPALWGSGSKKYRTSRGTKKTIQGDTADGQRGRKTTTTKRKRKSKGISKWRKFQRKVLTAVDKEKPFGHVTKVWTFTMSQPTLNKWEIYTKTGSGNPDFEFFTPRKYMDALSVAFNGKILNTNGYLSNTNNFASQTPMRIKGSYLKLYFRNTSQHKARIQLFFCYGKQDNSTSLPTVEWPSLIGTAVDGNENNLTLYGSEPWHNPVISKFWNVKKTEIILDMGQEQTHFMKGLSNMTMNLSNHIEAGTGTLTNPTWLPPNNKGNGCYLFLRYINEPTYALGGTCLRGINTTGGTCVEVTEYFNVKLGNNQVTPTGQINSVYLKNDYPTAGTDQEVNVDNPAVVISTPI